LLKNVAGNFGVYPGEQFPSNYTQLRLLLMKKFKR